MSNYSSLKATVNSNIKTNGNQEITGSVLNSVLNAMITEFGQGYQYMRMATPTDPGSDFTPDFRCFYIATTPGTYSHLGGLVVNSDEVAILKFDSVWRKDTIPVAKKESVDSLWQPLPYLTIIFNIDFSSKIINVGAGYLFNTKRNVAIPVSTTTIDFSAKSGLCYVAVPQGGGTPYIISYTESRNNESDIVFGFVDISRARVECMCRSLYINGEMVRHYSNHLYLSDAPFKFVRSVLSVDFINKTMTNDSGYIFMGRPGSEFVHALLAGSVSWSANAQYYIVYSISRQSLYLLQYDASLENPDDIVVGNLNAAVSRVVIDCSSLTINGDTVRNFNEADYATLENLENVTPMPRDATLPTSGWGNKNFNNPSGTDGIFWDVRNKIGQTAHLNKINVISSSSGVVRIHFIDSSYNTVAYEDHNVVVGENSFVPTTSLNYDLELYVGFQNISSGIRLIYPTDGTGRTKKKFLSDGHIVDQTLAYALWIDVADMQNTLPYRVGELERRTGITSLSQLKNAIVNGDSLISLGACDISLDSTLSIPGGTKISGVRGKSILRVPSGVLKGIELNGVEDVVIENITLIGAYNGTPITNGMNPVRSGIVNNSEQARTFHNAGYQTDMANGGVTSTYIPQIGINIRQCEKVEISGCEIKNFSYYGIANALSGKNYRYAMKVQNNYINNCYCGLYLYKEAERAQYIANNVALCQIGLYLDSGTNMFTDCVYSANRIGMFMNNGVNHAHGVQTGNAFTHCSLFSLFAYNIQYGEVFSQCKFGYCETEDGNFGGFAVVVKNSMGLSFQNCQSIHCRWRFDGKFYLAYNGYSDGETDQFGNSNYVVSYTDISGQEQQYNGGVNVMYGCEYITSFGGPVLSDDLDDTNVLLKNNFVMTGAQLSNINN